MRHEEHELHDFLISHESSGGDFGGTGFVQYVRFVFL